jgi:hypothetical protein
VSSRGVVYVPGNEDRRRSLSQQISNPAVEGNDPASPFSEQRTCSHRRFLEIIAGLDVDDLERLAAGIGQAMDAIRFRARS